MSETLQPHPLLAKIERFLAASKMSAARLGKDALNDPRFVYQLRKGRDPGWKTQQKIENFMRANAKRRAA